MKRESEKMRGLAANMNCVNQKESEDSSLLNLGLDSLDCIDEGDGLGLFGDGEDGIGPHYDLIEDLGTNSEKARHNSGLIPKNQTSHQNINKDNINLDSKPPRGKRKGPKPPVQN